MLLCCAITAGWADSASAQIGSWRTTGRFGAAAIESAGAGIAGEIAVSRAIGEWLQWDVQAVTSIHGNSGSSLRRANALTSGLALRWDVLRWVPYVSTGLGRYQLDGITPRVNGGHWGVPLRAGLEYLWDRDWVLSAQLSGHLVGARGAVGVNWAQLTVGIGTQWQL